VFVVLSSKRSRDYVELVVLDENGQIARRPGAN
jgi:hypothetical protein